MSNYKVDITGLNTNDLVVLKSSETIRLIDAMKKDPTLKDKIVMGNLKLVLSAIKPYRHQKHCLDDLFQVGVLGLIKAIDNFDTSKEVMFSTYAVPMIRGEIKRYIRDNTSLLKVSRQVKDLAYHCFKYKEEYLQKHENMPTYLEIAQGLDIKESQVKEAFESFNPIISFSDTVGGNDTDDLEFYDVVKDPDDKGEKLLLRLTLKRALESLDEMERQIIDKRYFEGLTQMEIASEFAISQAQVSRLEKTALRTLRKFF